MRRKKRTAMIAAFTLGAFLFAGTALADILDKSGYDQLKDAVKVTATNCTENYQSFTAEFSMAMKDNGKVIYSTDSVLKYDAVHGAKEDISSTEDTTNRGSSYGYYSYSDKNQSIRKSADDDIYIVTNYKDRKDEPLLDKKDNPFNNEEIKDIERILDALVVNLKDQVIVTENSDGGKSLSGDLSEAHIPALINALASFQMKQQFNGHRTGMIDLTSDVYVKEVSGTAKVNEEGGLENILGSAIVYGVDEEGKAHEISLEILFKLSDINSTEVVKPNITGKNVITQDERDYSKTNMVTPEKFVGQFKNDIIMEKDGKFIKIGERILQITSLNQKEVQGNYREELKEGFEKYTSPNSAYTFKAQFGDGENNSNHEALEITDEKGNKIKGQIYFDGYWGRVYLNINQVSYGNTAIFDSDFRPVFE